MNRSSFPTCIFEVLIQNQRPKVLNQLNLISKKVLSGKFSKDKLQGLLHTDKGKYACAAGSSN